MNYFKYTANQMSYTNFENFIFILVCIKRMTNYNEGISCQPTYLHVIHVWAYNK